MKLKTVLAMICAATMCGCVFRGDPAPPDSYYIYGNDTDWTITVECFTKVSEEGDEAAYRKDTSFVIAPGKEVTLNFFSGPLFAPFNYPVNYPGSYEGRYITYSNGEKTFRQEDSSIIYYRNPLFHERSYTKIAESLSGVYYKFVFTEENFEEEINE